MKNLQIPYTAVRGLTAHVREDIEVPDLAGRVSKRSSRMRSGATNEAGLTGCR
jgi:hypothetical protein